MRRSISAQGDVARALGSALRMVRRAHRLRARDVAERIGATPQELSHFEAGRWYIISAHRFEEIAEAYTRLLDEVQSAGCFASSREASDG